jgi:hypothetical protein
MRNGFSGIDSRIRPTSLSVDRCAARRAAGTSTSSRTSRQVFERDVLGLREKGEASVQELGDVVDRREGDVATATGALRRPDQVLGGEDAERFPNSGPVDAKLSRQRCFVRQALPRSQLARDDEFAELVVHLLVGLPDAANRHVLACLRG